MTTVVIQGPQGNGAPQNIREWSTGICGCCSNFSTCICGFFCFPCLLCRLSVRMDEHCCVACCLPGGLLAMRTKIRTQYGIRGSICSDWVCMVFCNLLTVCQMDRELQNYGR